MRAWACAVIGIVVLDVACSEDDERTEHDGTNGDPESGDIADPIGDIGDIAGKVDPTQVEEIDFDKDMPFPQKKERMQTCLVAMRASVKANPQIAEGAVNQIMSETKGDMSETQARNYASFFMMINCYQQISDEQVEMVKTSKEFGEGELERLMMASAAITRVASESHGKLWKLVVEEDAKLQASLHQQQQSGSSTSSTGGQPVVGGTGIVSILGFFAVVFGIAAFVILKMAKPAEKATKYQSGKSIAKKEKAEKMAAKKAR